MKPTPFSRIRSLMQTLVPALIVALSGCMVGPDYKAPDLTQAAQWQAPRPHDGSQSNLLEWWQQFQDPALNTLLNQAESGSPSLEQAVARITQARANLDISNATLWPSLTGRAGYTRGNQQQGSVGVANTSSGSLDAAWELDLFGKQRRTSEAAQARVEARVDDWYDARISLAAEVADNYVQYRGCELLVEAYRQQADSQQETLRLTRVSRNAGFTAPADVALAEASAASSASSLIEQRSQCDLLVKSLVELTGMPETDVRQTLANPTTPLPQPSEMKVESVPADLLRQRADLASSERELAATSAEIGVAEADRWPNLSLSGTLTVSSTGGDSTRLWSVGPALSLPLFDAGQRKAQVTKSQAAYDEALASYKQTLRTAVTEVEQALVRLDAAAHREADGVTAATRYQDYFNAIDRQWKAGGGSLLDREAARRSALTAEINLISLRENRVRYWIALYKALGGGWDSSTATAAPGNTTSGTTYSNSNHSTVAEQGDAS